jgi:hypothetical protein
VRVSNKYLKGDAVLAELQVTCAVHRHRVTRRAGVAQSLRNDTIGSTLLARRAGM